MGESPLGRKERRKKRWETKIKRFLSQRTELGSFRKKA